MTILITGVSRGIGRALTLEFARKGHNVIGVTRDLKGNASEILMNKYITLIEFNWIEFESLASKIGQLNLPLIDIVVNNAADIIVKDLMSTDINDIDRMMHANVSAPLILTQTLIKESLLRIGCHVVNISSMAGFQGASKFPGLASYSMSKSALVCLTECMAVEWRDIITPNCLCLGAVNTEMLKSAFPNYTAPINDVEMAAFICEFSLSAKGIVHGQVFPIKNNDPVD